MGLVEIPEIFIDNPDRNRTSPFAFTGNRFEFRAVGSSANCAGAMTTLNAAVAEQLLDFKTAVDKELAAGKTLQVAVMDTLKPIIASIIDTVCFDGNGYTDAWKAEAARRGLDTESCVPEMFKEFLNPSSVEMFARTGVYTVKELEARNEVKWETYAKKVQIEARVMVRMALNHIIPAAVAYKSALLKEVALYDEVYDDTEGCATELAILDDITRYVEEVRQRARQVEDARVMADSVEDAYARARAFSDIANMLFALRKPIDALEEVVDDKLWPLPKYRELLFIS
jgi:glutamine synthetase